MSMAEGRDDWPYALDCDHDDAKGEEWDRIEREAQASGVADKDIVYESDEYTRLSNAPTSFTDRGAEEVNVSGGSGVVTVVWKCPVCHQEHTEEYTRGDFMDA